jgi:hypothetical protein
MTMLHVSVHCQDYLTGGRFLTILKQPQPQQPWKIDMMLWWLLEKKFEQAMKRGKIKGSIMDSRTVMRVESEDDSQLRNLSYFA